MAYMNIFHNNANGLTLVLCYNVFLLIPRTLHKILLQKELEVYVVLQYF